MIASAVRLVRSSHILDSSVRFVVTISRIVVSSAVPAEVVPVYSALYQAKNAKISRKSKYVVEPIKDTLKKTTGKTLFIGDGIRVYREEILKHKGNAAILAPEHLWYPRASAVGFLGLDKLKHTKGDNPYDLVPLYIHPHTCTIK
ncbi:MAG: hypothetical protein ABIH01_01275 [Candidatus Omnitrophota bacterium]